MIERLLQYDELLLSHILLDTLNSLYSADKIILDGNNTLALELLLRKKSNTRYILLEFNGFKIIAVVCSQLYSHYQQNTRISYDKVQIFSK